MQRKKKAKPHIRFYLAALMFCLETLLIALFIAGIIVLPLLKHLWIVVLIIYISNTIGSFFLVGTNVNNGFKISWLVIINAIPIGGLIVYIMYADKLTTKRMKKVRFNKIDQDLLKGCKDCSETLELLKKESLDAYCISNYIYKNAFSSVFQGTNLTYFTSGESSFETILNELKKAKKFIFMEYFIIDHGIFFDSIYEILKKKAQEGVDVRLIYDDFGSVFKVKAFFYKQAIKDGIKCISFNRCRPTVDIRQNNRDHRKILVIDGVVGFSGGINIADEYINKERRFGYWKDNCFVLKGEAVSGLTNLFIANWNINGKDKLTHENYLYEKNLSFAEKIYENDGFIQPFGDVPFDNEETSRNVRIHLISRAKKYIYISSPYFVPDEELLQALILASRSGVDVRIITPGIPDKKLVYGATRSYYNKLIFNGIKVYEYTPGFNHLKCMVVDDEFCLTGTVNMDYRSLYLHFENDTLIYKNSNIPFIKKDLMEMFDVSKEIKEEDYEKINIFKKIWWNLLKIFAPLL